MKEAIIYNGKYIDKGTPIVSAENRGLRFGDGCFETMKVVNGMIALKELHFERLFSSLETLGFILPVHFNAAALEEKITALVKKNKCEGYARLRVTMLRGNGGLYDAENDHPDYIIEAWPLDKNIGSFNENGLVAGVFIEAKKVADNFSHIKANSFLPYVQGASWAKKNKLNDALILNAFNRVADTTIANVFIVADGIIKTPALSEGCVAGVMRKYLIINCRKEGLPIEECEITINDLQNANEVFFTNAIRGIKWVKQLGESGYSFQISRLLHNKFIKPLWL